MTLYPAYLTLLGTMMTATGKQSISKTPHIVRARQRLERAVAGLEQAIADGAQGPSEMTPGQARELAELKAENAGLRQTSQTVSGRLDDTIGKLKAVLDG